MKCLTRHAVECTVFSSGCVSKTLNQDTNRAIEYNRRRASQSKSPGPIHDSVKNEHHGEEEHDGEEEYDGEEVDNQDEREHEAEHDDDHEVQGKSEEAMDDDTNKEEVAESFTPPNTRRKISLNNFIQYSTDTAILHSDMQYFLVRSPLSRKRFRTAPWRERSVCNCQLLQL